MGSYIPREGLQSLKEYGRRCYKWIIVTIVVLSISTGWLTYRNRKESHLYQASDEYQQVMAKFMYSRVAADPDVLEAFARRHEDNDYPLLARMVAANTLVSQFKFEKSVSLLKLVVQQAQQPIQSLARLRLARVQNQLGRYDEALTTLEALLTESAFKSIAEEVRGDVLISKGDITGARSSYQQSLADGGNNSAIKLKLEDLSEE